MVGVHMTWDRDTSRFSLISALLPFSRREEEGR